MKPLKLRDRQTEVEISSDCPEEETQAEIWGRWQAALKIQTKEQNYQINNCQIYFLYDLKLIARQFMGSGNQMLEGCFAFIFCVW